MQPGFVLFDHTADIGVRVCASSLPNLLVPAVEGLYEVIGSLIAQDNAPASRRTYAFRGDDAALLLRDFLNELLFAFEHDHVRAAQVRPGEFSPCRLAVDADMVPVDFARSSFTHEVKAVTYHALAIRAVDGGYEAEYIVDI